MSNVIDYYFTPASGYAYLGHQPLMALARDCGARLRFLPVHLDCVHEPAGSLPPCPQSEAQQSYEIEDRMRLARMQGLRMTRVPAHEPVDARLACRVILAAGRLGLDQDSVTTACLRGVWAEGRNIADPGDLCEALVQIDLPAFQIMQLAQGDEMHDAADDAVQAAIDAQVFASPTCVLNGERFWGPDRIEFMREKLRRMAA